MTPPARQSTSRQCEQLRRASHLQRLLKLVQQLADSACLDGFNLQTREAHFQPVKQLRKLLSLHRAVLSRGVRESINPVLSTGTEEQRIVETFSLEVVEEIFIWRDAPAVVPATIPLI